MPGLTGGVGVAQGLNGPGEFPDALILVGQEVRDQRFGVPGVGLALLGCQEGRGYPSGGGAYHFLENGRVVRFGLLTIPYGCANTNRGGQS